MREKTRPEQQHCPSLQILLPPLPSLHVLPLHVLPLHVLPLHVLSLHVPSPPVSLVPSLPRMSIPSPMMISSPTLVPPSMKIDLKDQEATQQALADSSNASCDFCINCLRPTIIGADGEDQESKKFRSVLQKFFNL
ncbi:hypothetical protein ACS0PU_013197 [Formica fusca]